MRISIFYLIIFFSLITGLTCSGPHQRSLRIGYVMIDESPSEEDRKVIDWLKQHNRFHPVSIDVSTVQEKMDNVDVVWFHATDSLEYRKLENAANAVAVGYDEGRRFLLSGFAALLPHEAGLEMVKPEVRWLDIENDWIFDQRGLQSWRGHPSFDGMFGGAYLWDTYEAHRLPRIGYFDGKYPISGKIMGVEKSYITIHGQNGLMVEYDNDHSRIMCVGGFLGFSRRNRVSYRQNKFLENTLYYLANASFNDRPIPWTSREDSVQVIPFSSKPLSSSHPNTMSDMPRSDLVILSDPPTDAFFDLAGRRCLIMGKEKGGIEEVWIHPFRVLKKYRAGIVLEDSVSWLENMPCAVEIRPESLTRRYRIGKNELTEQLFASHQKPGSLINYRFTGDQPVRLVICFRHDMRWMWPYDEYALGSIRYGYDENLHAFRVKDRTGGFQSVFGSDVVSLSHIEGPFVQLRWNGDRFEGEEKGSQDVVHAAVFPLDAANDRSLNYCIVGTDQGEGEALTEYRTLLQNPGEAYRVRVDHIRHLLETKTTISTPDEELNTLWKWSLVATDRFIVNTPGIGTGFVAGYATSDKGWDGRHRVSGRPGYGWYFGRDASWSCFAVDDYGDFESVKQQLFLFRRFQDLSGKIFHELSTSGVVHYDAADATPLYIILAAHYYRASGDQPTIRVLWPSLKRAIDFLYQSDTDGDGLIENTDVGHGWVEGGKLWGAHTTFYLAGLWARTLYDASYLAGRLGEDVLKAQYADHAKNVRDILNTDFWNEQELFFHYGKLADGSFNPEKTVLPAVVMSFDLLDDRMVGPVLNQYAGNTFSSDWGVRILSSESPLFNPQGYHYGSVWPLYTGWTALAEYTYGRSTQAFMHILNNVYIKNHWALGLVEEVMNGVKYLPAGVCSHQCWSETNVLHPGIYGMIGWRPSAPEKEAQLIPRFPVHWDTVAVRNLRLGKSRIDFSMERSSKETHYRFTKRGGGRITLMFSPELPEGMIVEHISVNGEAGGQTLKRTRGHLAHPVIVNLDRTAHVILKHRGGIGVVPDVPRPRPGEISTGYRIVSARYEDERFVLDLEGKRNTTHPFRIRMFSEQGVHVEGADRVEKESGFITVHVMFPVSTGPYTKKQIIIHLHE